MSQKVRLPHAEIRIRGVRGWPQPRGREPAHVRLSAADRAELARLAEIIDFETPASTIFFQGDRAEFVYLLVAGAIKTAHTLRNGEQQILAFHWPGDLVGLAEDGKYVSSAQTLVASRVYRFPAQRLERFLRSHPGVEDAFLVKALHDLRAAQRQLIVMGKLTVAGRLAAFLVDCSAHDGYFDDGTFVLTLPMSRYDIADYLGTSSETIIRALARFTRLGIVQRLAPRELKLDLERLKGLARLG